MKPCVIAFLARAGHGKSTAAKHLVERHGAQIVSFAGPLKRLALRCLPKLTEEHVYGPTAVKEATIEGYDFSSVDFLQRLGNGAREEIHENVWINACITHILHTYEYDTSRPIFVIDDCRYLNEAETIANSADIDGRVIKLICPDAVSTRDPNHPSEAQVDQVPESLLYGTIVSHKSPESRELKEKLDAMIDPLLLGNSAYTALVK